MLSTNSVCLKKSMSEFPSWQHSKCKWDSPPARTKPELQLNYRTINLNNQLKTNSTEVLQKKPHLDSLMKLYWPHSDDSLDPALSQRLSGTRQWVIGFAVP